MFGHRFGFDQSRIDHDLYHLDLLHLLQGTKGVSRLLGIVLDEDGVVTAFLSELPSKGSLSDFLTDDDIFGQPITVQRRIKWCRQIVEIVARAHNYNMVIGTLGGGPNIGPFGIDKNDDIMLFRLPTKFFPWTDHLPGYQPPECRRLNTSNGLFRARPETNIYQLGKALWHVISKKRWLTRQLLCDVAGCDAVQECTAPHADPSELPMIEVETPQYLKDIIAGCRREDPNDRLSAHSLLGMFPAVGTDSAPSQNGTSVPIQDDLSSDAFTSLKINSIGYTQPTSAITESGESLKDISRAEDVKRVYPGNLTLCQRCGDVTTEHRFHCNTCGSGDYDICPGCFYGKSAHCRDISHYLLENRYGQHRTSAQKLYSNVKETGERHVMYS